MLWVFLVNIFALVDAIVSGLRDNCNFFVSIKFEETSGGLDCIIFIEFDVTQNLSSVRVKKHIDNVGFLVNYMHHASGRITHASIKAFIFFKIMNSFSSPINSGSSSLVFVTSSTEFEQDSQEGEKLQKNISLQ